MVMLAWDLGRLCRHDLLPDFSLARRTRWLPCAACAVTLWKAAGPTHSSALQTDVLFRSTVSPSSELSNPCMSGTQRQTTATTTTTATCATVAEPSVHSVPAVPGIVGRMRRSAGDCLRLPLARLPKPSSGAADKIHSNAHLEDIKDANGDQREYRCRWRSCQRGFQTLDDLVAHVNHCHVTAERGGEVEYQCLWEACPRKGKGFNARYKMLIHIRTHTNEKPHTCLVCGKSFSRLENLKIHNRSHTGEKPYLCPVAGCNKAYSNSSDRFKHVRTHQEQKPYTCKMPGCCKRYTDPSSLRKHVRTHGHFHRLGERSSTSLSSSSSPPSTPSSKTLSSLSPAVAFSVLDSLPTGTSPLPASVSKSEESSPPVSPSKVSPPPLPPSPAVDSEANSNIRRHCSQYLLPLTGSLFPLAVGLTPPSFTSEGLIHAPRSLLSNTQTGSTEDCDKSHFQPKIVRPLPVFLTGVDPYSTMVPAKGKCGRGAVRHHQDGPLDLSCTPSSLAAVQLARCHSVHPFQELVHNVGAN